MAAVAAHSESSHSLGRLGSSFKQRLRHVSFSYIQIQIDIDFLLNLYHNIYLLVIASPIY